MLRCMIFGCGMYTSAVYGGSFGCIVVRLRELYSHVVVTSFCNQYDCLTFVEQLPISVQFVVVTMHSARELKSGLVRAVHCSLLFMSGS